MPSGPFITIPRDILSKLYTVAHLNRYKCFRAAASRAAAEVSPSWRIIAARHRGQGTSLEGLGGVLPLVFRAQMGIRCDRRRSRRGSVLQAPGTLHDVGTPSRLKNWLAWEPRMGPELRLPPRTASDVVSVSGSARRTAFSMEKVARGRRAWMGAEVEMIGDKGNKSSKIKSKSSYASTNAGMASSKACSTEALQQCGLSVAETGFCPARAARSRRGRRGTRIRPRFSRPAPRV